MIPALICQPLTTSKDLQNDIIVLLISRFEARLKQAASDILSWDAIQAQPVGAESSRHSRATLDLLSCFSTRTAAIFHTETVCINNDLAAVKRLGMKTVDFADRNVLRELKFMKDIKVW